MTDPDRKLTIEEHGNLFIPMEIEGYTCGLLIIPPTDNDLNECQHILISYELE